MLSIPLAGKCPAVVPYFVLASTRESAKDACWLTGWLIFLEISVFALGTLMLDVLLHDATANPTITTMAIEEKFIISVSVFREFEIPVSL